MGSPLGPLLANVFMCSIEENLEIQGLLPSYYRRYVDDTLTIMPNVNAAQEFLNVLNNCHSSISFTMETEKNKMLPFLGIQLINSSSGPETKVYIKPTNTGLLLHYKSHVDERYKQGLLTTMLDRAYKLSSRWEYFTDECTRLKDIFSRLQYPDELINKSIRRYISKTKNVTQKSPNSETSNQDPDKVLRIVLPFKGQNAADMVRKDLKNLELKTDICLEAVFVSPKLARQLKYQEPKPEIINQQRVVYEFLCPFCTESYVGYTMKHLHERCTQHRNLSSSIGKHLKNKHGTVPKDLSPFFKVIKKCKSKFDCLVFEMLFIRQKRPSLNVQSDSIKAKVF